MSIVFHIHCAVNQEDKVVVDVLFDVGEMSDEVEVAKKTKAPVK